MMGVELGGEGPGCAGSLDPGETFCSFSNLARPPLATGPAHIGLENDRRHCICSSAPETFCQSLWIETYLRCCREGTSMVLAPRAACAGRVERGVPSTGTRRTACDEALPGFWRSRSVRCMVGGCVLGW